MMNRSLRLTLVTRIIVPILLLTGGAGLLFTGCFTASDAIDTGIDAAAEAAGEEVGKAVGQQLASAANLPPAGTGRWNQFMVTQAQVLFNYAFSAGGMWPAQATYEPGEWAMYRLGASGEGGAALDTLERAFLRTTSDGNEWWRVRGVQQGETWIYEALVDPKQEEVLRLRSKDPNGEVGEVPVTEKTVYRPPQRLTEESIEGATVGKEQIETPAGAFTARRVEYAGAAASGTVTWLLTDEVPGDVVRYQVANNEGSTWTSTLIDFGTDATTSLDSY